MMKQPSGLIQTSDYKGPDRRMRTRRSGRDRRELIRFELDNEDRRSHRDRRKNNHDIWEHRDF